MQRTEGEMIFITVVLHPTTLETLNHLLDLGIGVLSWIVALLHLKRLLTRKEEIS